MKKLRQGCDHPETPYVVVVSWSMIISGIIVTQETGDSKYVLWYTTDESDDLKFTSVSAEQSASLEVMSRSKGRRATVDIIEITNFFYFNQWDHGINGIRPITGC